MDELVTRRSFLNFVGRAAGASALYETMSAMGLVHVPIAYAGPPDLAPGSGSGRRVVVLGAGIAGLVAAYELTRANYACTILEARNRAGGRNWTLRRGDIVEETDSRQACGFDQGTQMYFNAGAARISQHHQAILGYCKKFGVPLEAMVNENRNAFFQSDKALGGRPIRARQIIADQRGYIAELLAKAVNQRALDEALTADDQERFLVMLRNFGALDKSFQYKGSSRAGYAKWPGAADRPGESLAPLAFTEFLESLTAYFQTNFGERIDWQPTMLQPVGGMDKIARAFERRVRSMIRYGAEVHEIRRHGEGVRIGYRDAATGKRHSIEADYCVCTIPLSVLADIDADFSPGHQQAIRACHYVKACKLAFQANRRFWEEDDQIYGGISWTDQAVTQIWYPSTGFHRPKGILVGAYIWTDRIGEQFGQASPAQRNVMAIQNGAKLHPNYGQHLVHGISVAWHKIPHSKGAYAEWSLDARRDAYVTLCRPDGPIHFAGEHLSYMTAWQEGAVLSAQSAALAIHERAQKR
jgi:monoamine oxidase